MDQVLLQIGFLVYPGVIQLDVMAALKFTYFGKRWGRLPAMKGLEFYQPKRLRSARNLTLFVFLVVESVRSK
jgi:hypothetical protein